VVDGLPAGQLMRDHNGQDYYGPGFDLGQLVVDTSANGNVVPYLNNHYDVTIEYHKKPDGKVRVVGVIVLANSLSTAEQENKCVFNPEVPGFALANNVESKVLYTYSVKWVPKDISWGTRWDNYLHVFDANVQ
jgi:transmembrane 9 superfamily protein 2/4